MNLLQLLYCKYPGNDCTAEDVLREAQDPANHISQDDLLEFINYLVFIGEIKGDMGPVFELAGK